MTPTLQTAPAGLEILDLRHFSAAQLAPLLRDEASRWRKRLHWDYAGATSLLLDYLDGRVLPGFVALDHGRILGYAFCVFEAAKAVIGDIYSFGETERQENPVCDLLLRHLLEMLQATPAVDRIEAQLLMFPAGALVGPYRSFGFRSFPRLFMLCELGASPMLSAPVGVAPGLTLVPWQADFYEAAASLIHRAYLGHIDAEINDQYRTLHGAQRFLHNIIRFPGCGVFDLKNSWALRDTATGALAAMLLCSRVSPGTAHITQLCTDPALRGLGLGYALMAHCAVQAHNHGIDTLSLTVTEANLEARRLYERNGFRTHERFEAMVWES